VELQPQEPVVAVEAAMMSRKARPVLVELVAVVALATSVFQQYREPQTQAAVAVAELQVLQVPQAVPASSSFGTQTHLLLQQPLQAPQLLR
jgi:hypothetical protein